MKYKSCTDYWLDKENFSLRGDFEAMYKDIDDPWGCGEYCDSLNNKLFCEMLFHHKNYSELTVPDSEMSGQARIETLIL